MVGPPVAAGLCERCCHLHKIESGRGSVFYLCRRAAVDPRLEKYPHLPVRTCHGYEEVEKFRP